MPGPMAEMVAAAGKGDYGAASGIHRDLGEIFKALFLETNPIPVKTALEMMGMIKANLRLPLCEMGTGPKKQLRGVLKDLKLI